MDHKYCYRREREHTTANPSFSSTLLDAIYRSIDETETPHQGVEEEEEEEEEDQLVVYKETMRKKQSNITTTTSSLKPNLGLRDEEEMANYQRACLIEKWMEKKVVVRRNFQRKEERTSEYDASSACTFFNSSSSSSDSSCGGGFSSSEAESVYGVSSSRTSCYGLNKPKPIRTSVSVLAQQEKSHQKREKDYNSSSNKYGENFQPKAKPEGSFVKTKSRALKIYGDLKKVKQPISPGGRLASFLNSIFTAGNTKKAKLSSSGVYDGINSERKLKSANASTCSSASSISRSCLSKAPSSRGKSSNNGLKRSVRFYPVSVIVDEDCQPCGQKSLCDDDDKSNMDLDTVKNIRSSLNKELNFHALEKNRRVEEAARDLLRNFHNKVDHCDYNTNIRNARINDQEFQNLDVDDEDDDDDQDEDDAASYASSDLFELDNLSAIGMGRYREELPVYETTHLGTNRAIANGLIL